jgi:2'-5' RNA ligase
VTPTETALIVPLPALEPAVGEFRRELDHSAPWGVPPHVTVCYPFMPPAMVTADVTAALPRVPAFECTFRDVRWFGDDVVWLAPEPDGPFRALTAEVLRRFPDHPPYGGQFADPIPHLTIGSTRLGTYPDLRNAGDAVAKRLPVAVAVDRMLLIAGTDAPGSWHTVAEVAF